MLPHVRIGELTGFMERLHALGDREDLYELARDLHLKADELLPAVRKALDQVGGELSDEERAVIAQRVSDVEEAVAAGAAQPLKRANAALDEATQRLATLLIERAMR